MQIGVLTVSDRAAAGTYEDVTGAELVDRIRAWNHDAEVETLIVADERSQIEDALRRWSDEEQMQLIVTSGGTGLSARDVTPEATEAVIDRNIPGLAELMRAAGALVTPLAALSRQVTGQRQKTLIINLPGSPKGATECFDAIVGVLEHAIEVINS